MKLVPESPLWLRQVVDNFKASQKIYVFMLVIEQLRREAGYEPIVEPVQRPDLYDFLGKTPEEQALAIGRAVIPESVPNSDHLIEARLPIWRYILDFLKRSTLYIPYMARSINGRNLAFDVFLAPSGSSQGKEHAFAEQYRWDTYFQNRGLIAIGAIDIARKQLANIAYVFDEFGRVPNALDTSFLSHPQPPLEAYAVFDLINAGGSVGDWSHKIIRLAEADLVTEWWDLDSGRKNPRQSRRINWVERFGEYITRYTNVHYHPLLDGCQAGTDHNWVIAAHGSNHLPVQLNAIIYGTLGLLSIYYQEYTDDSRKAGLYKDIQLKLRDRFNQLFWVKEGKFRGFRNYSIVEGEEGPIQYGDLSAEIWPLWVGLATPEQAEVTRENIAQYYAGDIGIAATSEKLRTYSSLEAPVGWECQWELNCWPPFMLIAAEALMRYSQSPTDAFAQNALSYQHKWVRWAENEFRQSGGFHEKGPYDSSQPVEQGYYGVLKGFGWTIATYMEFLKNLALHGRL